MKFLRTSFLILAVFALASCSPPVTTGSSSQITNRTVSVYQGGTLQASYVLDASGKILQSRFIGEFEVWTTRTYNYDSNGDVLSIDESYDGSAYTNTKVFSTSRSLSRSGKVLSKSLRINDYSTVPSRASRSSERVYTYSYDDQDALTSISKVDQDDNSETKTLSWFDAAGLGYSPSLSLASSTDPTATAIPVSSVVASPRATNGRISGSSFGIYADVHDYRPTGIKETYSRSGEDIATSLDKLKQGEIFIDDGGTARQILSVTKNGLDVTYVTAFPDFIEFLNEVTLPAATYNWEDFDVKPEYMPAGLTISTAEGSTASDRWKLQASTTLSYKTDLFNDAGGKSGKLETTISPSVNFDFDYGLEWGYPGFWSWHKGSGRGIFKQDISIAATVTAYYAGKKKATIPLYPQGLGTDGASISVGIYMIPELRGQVSLSNSITYNYKNTSGVTWVMGKWWIPQNFQTISGTQKNESSYKYAMEAKASIDATLKVIAVGGQATLFGQKLVESLPGLGPYFTIEGGLSTEFEKANGSVVTSKTQWNGKVEFGLFMEATFSIWNSKWSWNLLTLKNPWISVGGD